MKCFCFFKLFSCCLCKKKKSKKVRRLGSLLTETISQLRAGRRRERADVINAASLKPERNSIIRYYNGH